MTEVAPGSETPAAPEVVAGALLNDGNQPEPKSWVESVPDKFKKDGEINHEAIFQSYNQLEQKTGKFGLPPESPDKYEFTPPTKEGEKPLFEIKEEAFKEFKQKCFDRGMSQKQFEESAKDYYEIIPQIYDEIKESLKPDPKAQMEKAEGALREAWKTQEEFDKNMELSEKGFAFLEKFGIKAEGFINNPDGIKALAIIGKEFGEDKGALGSMPSEDVEALRRSPAYLNQNHKDHSHVVAQVNRAYGLIK